MKIAVIDLGTNTFHLLIGEYTNHQYREITKKRIYVHLGQGMEINSHISLEAQLRALEAMSTFKKILHEHDVKHVYAVATSAIRTAVNGQELIARIQVHSGIEVTIISGTQESMLIYAGVKATLALGSDISLIMDIGGGSVEFILCNDQEALWERSFEIGAQRLMEQFHTQDPILPDELRRLEAHLEKTLAPLFEAMDTYRPTQLIGTSGAFTSLVSIHRGQTASHSDPQAIIYTLPPNFIEEIYEDVRYKRAEERNQIPRLRHEKVDMIVVSSALIRFILHRSSISTMLVSNYDLKVGLFYQVMEEIKGKGLADL